MSTDRLSLPMGQLAKFIDLCREKGYNTNINTMGHGFGFTCAKDGDLFKVKYDHDYHSYTVDPGLAKVLELFNKKAKT